MGSRRSNACPTTLTFIYHSRDQRHRDPLTRHCSGNNIYRPPSAIAWVVHTLLSRVSEDDCYINSLCLRLPCLPGETTGGWCWSTRQHIPEHSHEELLHAPNHDLASNGSFNPSQLVRKD